jgi:acetoacetyl-CoA synthetase
MTAEVHDGDVLRPVPVDARDTTLIGDYVGWLESERSLRFEGYDDLYAWSVEDLDAFWQSIWDFFEVRSHSPHTAALADATMPGAVWFPGATLNYAEHAVGTWREPSGIALIERSQTREAQPAHTAPGSSGSVWPRATASSATSPTSVRRPSPISPR